MQKQRLPLRGVLGVIALLTMGCAPGLLSDGQDDGSLLDQGAEDTAAQEAATRDSGTPESGAADKGAALDKGLAQDQGAALDKGLAQDQGAAPDKSAAPDSAVPLDTAAPADAGSPPKYPKQTKLTAYTVPTHNKPGYLASYIDATFGTKTTRVTDKAAFGLSSNIVRHNYSKIQPWNSDSSLIYIAAGGTLLSGKTYLKVGNASASGEVRWSNTDPKVIWNVDINAGKINRLTVVPGSPYTTSKTTLTTLTGFDGVYLGPWEGNVDDSDKYIAVLGKKGTTATATATAVVWDLQQNVEVSRKVLPEAFDSIDWISISPSGKYVVVQTNGSGTDIYNRDFTGYRQLVPGDGHADMGYDTAGKECLVHGVWFSWPIHVQIWSTPLDGSPGTVQFNNTMYRDWDGDHVSMRARGRPGWAYISVNNNTTGANKIEKHCFSLKLDGAGATAGAEKVNQWAHTYATAASYDRNAFAVPNRDGTKVMFASDWGNSSGEVNSYIVEMP